MTLFATKPIATLRAEAEATGAHALVRALGPLNLVTLGIGAVIGASPASLTAPPTPWCTAAQAAAHVAGCAHPALNLTGAVINLPAVLIVALMSAVLVIGIRESARVNSVIVILKVAIVLLVVLVSLSHIDRANWTPFIPPNTGEWGTYGWSGV